MFMFSFIICSAKRTSFVSFLRGESFLMILCYDTLEISTPILDSEPLCRIVPGIRWSEIQEASL
jgi:hypothetical protein